MHNSSVCLTNYPSTQRVTLNNVPRSSFHLISWNVGPSPPHPPHLGQISDTIGQPGKKTWFPACFRHNYIFDPADQHFLQNLLRKQQTIFMTASFNNTTTNRCHWDNGLILLLWQHSFHNVIDYTTIWNFSSQSWASYLLLTQKCVQCGLKKHETEYKRKKKFSFNLL